MIGQSLSQIFWNFTQNYSYQREVLFNIEGFLKKNKFSNFLQIKMVSNFFYSKLNCNATCNYFLCVNVKQKKMQKNENKQKKNEKRRK